LAAAPHLEFEKDIVEIREQIEKLLTQASEKGMDVADEVGLLRSKLETLKEETYRNLSPIQQVQVARHPQRPYTLDYIPRVFTDWIELHGDRAYRDDAAIVGGWARLDGRSVMVIGHQKGRDMKENLLRNFGMPHPEGYRKALRLMRMAEKFGRPVVTLIDTPGAYPGIGAIFNAPDREEAERLLGKTVEKYREKAARLAVWMEDNLPDGFAIFAFPAKHRRRLRTTNMVERQNREIRRRTRVSGLFPNEASLLRLVSAILMEVSEEWESADKAYLKLGSD
jgi:hypothetical protein